MLLVSAVLALALGWLWTPDRPRDELEARYSNGPGDFVEVQGVRLHVRDSGPKDASPLLLVHGFGSSLHGWEAWAAALAGTHRVVRLDLPGAGLSGADPTGRYTDERGMELLLALMDRLGLPSADLIGHSMGGRLAWRFAAAHPERVRKLVLVAPDGFASPGIDYGRTPDVPLLAQLMRYSLPKPLVRASLTPAYADPALVTDALLTRYHELLLAPGVRQAIITRMQQSVLPDPRPILMRIHSPTLLLWGAQDAMIPVANAQDYLRALPNARLVTLAGVGHLPQEEAPDASLSAVEAFLRE